MSPPEMRVAGASIWENQVGTGPFMLEEYVVGSHMSYVRNPNYWYSTTINGVEYQLPFVDKLVYPIIPDESTQVAALRTAVVDIDTRVGPAYIYELEQTAPKLLTSYVRTGNPISVWLRTDKPPLDNRNVRRALFIGTNRKAILDAILGGVGALYDWPLAEGVPGYVPLAELPPETRLLYDYNPELARQMLADEGYPDGFKIEMLSYVPMHRAAEIAEMVSGMWENDLGVEVDLKILEHTLSYSIVEAEEHPPLFVGWGSNLLPLYTFEAHYVYTGVPGRRFSMYSNPELEELFAKAKVTVDTAERTAILEKLFIMVTDDAVAVPIAHPFELVYWWPWVKNYYGETARMCLDPPYEFMWLDLDLKAEMGY
ncbi:Heme-binding protein A [subsurface metagenome]